MSSYSVKITADPSEGLANASGAAQRAIDAGLVSASRILVQRLREAVQRTTKGGTGALANSFVPAPVRHESGKTVAGAFSTVPYARKQDQGGEIRARNVQNLTIPLPSSVEAARKTARDFGDRLVVIKTNNKAFLAENFGDKLKFHYVLKRSVVLPAKRYTDMAIQAFTRDVKALFGKRIRAELDNG